MIFAHPAWLVGLWLAPLVLGLTGYAQRRRARILGGYVREGTAGRLVLGADPRRRWLDGVLLASAVALLVLALAGPRYGYHWRSNECRGVDLMVALDCSRSMLAGDVEPSRLDRAKREVQDLLPRLEGDRIGLVAFAGTAFLQCPLTLDYSGLHIFLRALSPEFLPVGGTALGEAIRVALASFDEHSAADRAILILTDGEETAGAAAEAVAEARERGVTVYVVGVGTPAGAPIPAADGGFVRDAAGNIVLARLDEAGLRDWALASGGAYVRSVAGDQDRDAIYERMRADLELKTLTTRKVKVWEERYQWPLAVAVLSLLVMLAGPAYAPVRGRRGWPLPLVLAGLLFLGTATGARAAGAGGWVRQGLQHYRGGNYEAAADAFLQAQVEAPQAPEVAFNLGAAQYRSGDFAAAQQSFSAALVSASAELQVAALYNRGNAAFKLGDLEQAVADYRAVLAAAPQHEDALLNLAFARKMQQQQQQQEPGDGEQQSDQAQHSGQAGADEAGTGEAGAQPPPGGAAGAASARQQETGEAQPGEGAAQPFGQQAGASAAVGEEATPRAEDEEEAAGAQGNDEGGAAAAQSAPATGRAGAQADNGVADPAAAVDQQRARALLNRLVDQPGKALMPRYRPRQVEKDW